MIDEPSWPSPSDMAEGYCNHCKKPLDSLSAVWCVCAKYGVAGHDEAVWCCEDCMLSDHKEENWQEYDKRIKEAKQEKQPDNKSKGDEVNGEDIKWP